MPNLKIIQTDFKVRVFWADPLSSRSNSVGIRTQLQTSSFRARLKIPIHTTAVEIFIKYCQCWIIERSSKDINCARKTPCFCSERLLMSFPSVLLFCSCWRCRIFSIIAPPNFPQLFSPETSTHPCQSQKNLEENNLQEFAPLTGWHSLQSNIKIDTSVAAKDLF